MVKLLRYYVSEDAVYLHLEHVKGELLKNTLITLVESLRFQEVRITYLSI